MSTKDAREETDESLAGERARADAAIHEKSLVELQADGAIERAREDADDVLTAARAHADAKLSTPSTPEQTRAELVKERAREDQLLDAERATADENLRKERALSARVLARLIPLEREKTDQYLMTERARSDHELANRDDFLGMVSHDLRDLLNIVVLSASYIADHAEDPAEATSSQLAAKRIQRSAGRMGRLISDLVDISSIDAGKLRIRTALTEAGPVLHEALETWAPPALAKGITLQLGAITRVEAMFDHERVLQVLGNLVTNSLKFSAPAASLTLGVAEVDGEVRFSVTDTGAGIESSKLEAIFERFSQVGNNDRRGLGLGLYISRCIIEAHGGRIWCESEPGVGSTFFFTVPVTSPPATDHAPA